MFRMIFVVYNLNIYRDGSLPAIHQEIHSTNLHILRCSYWAIQSWNHTNLSSPYWRLYWNQRSGASAIWNGEAFPLQPDRLTLISPNTPFQSSLEDDAIKPTEANTLIGFPYQQQRAKESGKYVCHFFTHYTLGQPYDQMAPNIFEIEIGEESLQEIHILIKALGSHRERLNHRQSFALHSLIHRALEHIADDDWPDRQMDSRVLRILHHIEAQSHQPMDNALFGKLAGMSPNAFTRLFRDRTGSTPLAHLTQRRIEKASILLHHTDHSIEEIAEACGFSDRYYFTRVFQKQFGIGPAGYRKHRAS